MDANNAPILSGHPSTARPRAADNAAMPAHRSGAAARRQSGSAILTAMLTVALVATLASSALWQQWRSTEIEGAQRTRLQAHWILGGALDWGRLILAEDARNSTVTYLSQPWAVPLQEARLSTFVAANESDATAQDLPDIYLSGHIIDLQSRLNISNLIQNGVVDPGTHAAFVRLFHILQLDPSQLDTLTQMLQQAQKAAAPSGFHTPMTSSSPPPATTGTDTVPNAPLMPLQVDQLTWLGLSPAVVDQLRPYVCLLPFATPVNLNTASAEVLYAAISSLEWPDAQQFVRMRDQKHLLSLSDAQSRSGLPPMRLNDSQHAVSSQFFEVHSRLRTDQIVTQELAVLQRNGMLVTVLSRQVDANESENKNPD